VPLPSSVELSSPRSWMEYVREVEPSYVPDPRDLASLLEEIGDVLPIGAVIVVVPLVSSGSVSGSQMATATGYRLMLVCKIKGKVLQF